MENFNFIKLSRVEMKDVLGGLVDPGSPGGPAVPGDGGIGGCRDGGCLLYVGLDNINQWLSGSCSTSFSGGLKCTCVVQNGAKSYHTNNGGTTCY
jgi:hypothetical protein